MVTRCCCILRPWKGLWLYLEVRRHEWLPPSRSAWSAPLLYRRFLKNRQFSDHLGAGLSGLFDQEMGVPQGSVLSVTLFALKINSIVKAISPGVECSLYVDDFLIFYRSKYILLSSISSALLTCYHTGLPLTASNSQAAKQCVCKCIHTVLQTSLSSSESRTYAQWHSHSCCSANKIPRSHFWQ